MSKDTRGAFWLCVQCVLFSIWDEGCVGVSGRDGEAVGCDEWGVSADVGGAFWLGEECVVFSRWDEGCVGGPQGCEDMGCDESGECLQTRLDSDQVTIVSFFPDGTKVASESFWINKVKLWDVTTGAYLQTLRGYRGDVINISFYPDDSKLLTASSEEVIIYKMPSAQQEARMMLRPAVKLDRLDLLHSILNSF